MIKIGDKAVLTRSWSRQDVDAFSKISGDNNPIHLDEEFAQYTRYGKCIVHGFLVGSLISTIIGTKLPGEGAVYIYQEMRFKNPVFLGEEILCEVEVIDIIPEKSHIRLKTNCFKQGEQPVIEGTALIKYKIA